jgi:hypothetical protein
MTYVYDFSEGNRHLADLLGDKGANLAEMTGIALPVPPGFTISTEACRAYLGHRPPAHRACVRVGLLPAHDGAGDRPQDYMSCSPFRIPIARLEAGRAAVGDHDGSADTR